MKIGIVFKKGTKKAEDLAKVVSNYLSSKKVEVVSESKLSGADYILSLGGDGTLIHKACEHAHFGATFVGINAGNLGFLTAVDEADWQKAVDAILAGKIFVSERMMLEATISDAHSRSVAKGELGSHSGSESQAFRGVNEAVIKGLYRVVEVKVRVNGEEFLKIVGDGVIISTQTGSTAYSLSAGGPIVDPELDSFLITPTNPIGLPIPSAVMSADDSIEVEVAKGEDVSLIIDGQEHTKINQSEIVKVERGKDRIKFGYLSKQHFIKALNAKFGLAGRLLK